MKIPFDKFYTKPEMARRCISMLDLSLYSTIIEPSAGGGAFSSQIEGCLAYDIAPDGPGIIRQDFLKLEGSFSRLLVVGNPPFGERASLAKAFISHSIKIGAETIAFVLPDTFNKISMQRVFPGEWHLVKKWKPDETFFEADGKDYYVPTTFFIWSRVLPGEDLREREIKGFSDFTFLRRGDQTADFTINGNSGKIKSLDEVTNPKAEHYIRGSAEARDILSSIRWNPASSVNGGNAWLGRQEIIKEYLIEKNRRDEKAVPASVRGLQAAVHASQ